MDLVLVGQTSDDQGEPTTDETDASTADAGLKATKRLTEDIVQSDHFDAHSRFFSETLLEKRYPGHLFDE